MAKSCPLSQGLHFEIVPLAGIKALLTSWEPLWRSRRTRSFLRGWGGSYPRATLLSQLQGLESHGAFSLKPFLLPTGIELTPEESLGFFRVVELTEPRGQTSRAQGECSQEQESRRPLLEPAWHGSGHHPVWDTSGLPEPTGESPGS